MVIMQKDYLLPVSILIAGVLIAGAVIYSTGLKGSDLGANVGANLGPDNSNPDSQAQVSLDLTGEDVILGDPKAPVTVMIYSDLQCPFCGRFYSGAESLIKENYVKTGKVRMVYRHFAFLGPESLAAAEAVECAKDQGKFWEYHDILIDEENKDGQEHNGNLNESLFKSLAGRLGMNVGPYSACLAEGKYAGKVKSDYSAAQAIGIQSTPTIFVNKYKVEGAMPYDYFKEIIENELNKL